MAFCSSCGTKNPDGAKFCAGCGQALAASVPPSPAPAEGMATQPQQPAAPKPMTAREALRSQPPEPPAGVRSEPDPNAPGQTQFFMAAAQVNAASRVKRVLIFIVGAIVLGVVTFLALRYAWQAKEASMTKETSAVQPAGEPGASAEPGQPTAEPEPPKPSPSDKSADKPADGKPTEAKPADDNSASAEPVKAPEPAKAPEAKPAAPKKPAKKTR